MLLSLVFSLTGWAAGWWLWGRPRTVADPADTGTPGRQVRHVTAIVPARNEAAVLGGLLADLVDQTVECPVVVLDDHSTDGTGTVARTAAAAAPSRVHVVSVPALPAGWVGKSWACHHGALAAASAGGRDDDVLVFLDADVRLAPGAVDQVASMVRRGRVVSVQPFHTTRRRYEQLSLFPGLVALAAIGAGRRGRPPSGACGPMLAMTAADHRRVGGHAAVRDEVVEDLALGARFLDAGIDVRVLLGGRSVRYRMYPAGPRQLVEGWTKNLATGAGSVPWWRTASVAAWIATLGDAAIDLARVAVFAPGSPLLLPLVVYGAFATQIALLGRRIGTFGPGTAVAYPVPLAAFVALFARSVWHRAVRRRVEWRGRSVPTGGVRTPT